jgi:hypothetical protein
MNVSRITCVLTGILSDTCVVCVVNTLLCTLNPYPTVVSIPASCMHVARRAYPATCMMHWIFSPFHGMNELYRLETSIR